LVIEIDPVRILFFDQTNLPRSIPTFQSFFAADGIFYIVELLKMNKPINSVLLCEAFG